MNVILEIAQIQVKEGLEEEFEAAVARATAIFRRARGCRGFELRRSVERPSRYRLLVRWDDIEAHTVDFHTSGNFAEWRTLVGHCFESIPEVEHMSEVLRDGIA